MWYIKIFLSFLLFSHSFSNDFISIKEITNKANLRKGPGEWYPIKWIINTPNLPLKVIDRNENFNKVELHDGTQGWLSKILTSNKHNLIVVEDTNLIDRNNKMKAKVLKHFIIKKHNCDLEKKPKYCKVQIKKIKGYIRKSDIWGY